MFVVVVVIMGGGGGGLLFLFVLLGETRVSRWLFVAVGFLFVFVCLGFLGGFMGVVFCFASLVLFFFKRVGEYV